jgi:hypothetical protein
MTKFYTFLLPIFLTVHSFAGNVLKFSLDSDHLPPDSSEMIQAMDKAAGDLIFSDDFSDPTNWVMTDLAGEGAEWEITDTEPEEILDYLNEMNSTTADNGFGLFNGVQYLISGTVTSQDAVLEMTETIDCSEYPYVSIRFEQRYRAYSFDQVFIEVSNNDGVSYDFQYEINADVPWNELAPHDTVNVNITEAAGGQEFVRIRFRWQSLEGDPSFGSGFGWMVDDLSVYESWDYDQEIVGAYARMGVGGYLPQGMDYYKIPVTQVSEIQFSGETKNNGALTLENNQFQVEISGADDFEATSLPYDLASFASDSVGTEFSYTPSPSAGDYEMKYWFGSDSTDQFPTNDTLYGSFKVTNDPELYSRSNGELLKTIQNAPINEGAPFVIGNVMEFFNHGDFCLVRVWITDEEINVGQLIYAIVYKLNVETGNFEWVAQSSDREITTSMLGTWYEFHVDFTDVNPGEVYFLGAGHYGGSDEVSFGLSQPVDTLSVFGFTSGSTEPYYLSDPRAVMINARINDYGLCHYNNPEIQQLALTIDPAYPNPFTNETIMHYTLQQPTDVRVEIRDITGKTIYEEFFPNQTMGNHQFRWDASQIAAGLYQCTFTTEHGQQTQQLIRE